MKILNLQEYSIIQNENFKYLIIQQKGMCQSCQGTMVFQGILDPWPRAFCFQYPLYPPKFTHHVSLAPQLSLCYQMAIQVLDGHIPLDQLFW
jgi:hypothetical protein